MPDEASRDELRRLLASGELPPLREARKFMELAVAQLGFGLPEDLPYRHTTSADDISKSLWAAMAKLRDDGNQYPYRFAFGAAYLDEIEANLRRILPEISRRLPEVETAADAIAADPEKASAVEQISGAVKRTAASSLAPAALLVVLWWLFVVAFPKDAATDVAVLALWYAVARDIWKKDD